MKKVTITEKEAQRYNFPAKAIGNWMITKETSEYKILHRLTKDGRFGSDRPNNVLKVKKLDIDKFFNASTNKSERLLTAKASNGKDIVIARSYTEDLTDNDDEPKVEPSSKAEENVKIEDEEVSGEDSKIEKTNLSIGTRKARWIDQLLKKFEEDPFLSKLLDDVDSLTQKILEDTDPEKGKKYSSIESAIRVWNIRIRKADA